MPVAKVVVITGASAGIGRALARRFAREGASIGLLARGSVGLDAAAKDVEELGGRAWAIQVDVADPDAVEAAAEQIEQELGPIDVWINNATTMVFGRVDDVQPDEVRRVSDVAYHGAVWGTKAALARMRERGRGTIVQVGSGASYRALPLMSSYCAAKHAIRGFTDSLRVELMHDGVDIHLTMVHLSAINTPLYTWARNHLPRQAKPFAPVYQPEVAADVIHWAASARRREVFVGWSALAAVTVNKLVPGLVDRVLTLTAFSAQQGAELVLDDQTDNLFEPVEGDFGAHGKFDDEARSRAPLVKLIARRGCAGLRTAVAVGVSIVLVLAGRAMFGED